MASESIGIGIIGFGFMGRTHAAGYLAAGGRARLIGVVGRPHGGKAGRREGLEGGGVWFENAEALLARDDIQAVSICTYTDSHVDLALAALALGKHVLVEKPVSLRSSEVARLADAAREAERVCMPAMCMRFWPGWPWLRDTVLGGELGAVCRAEFTRTGARPTWGTDFYLDPRRSGGALFDLHIHDVDFIQWCFGDPVMVSSSGTVSDVTTHYRFADSPVEVTARGAWLPELEAPFSMQYEVEFEHGVVRFDLAASPQLLIFRGAATEAVPLPEVSAYDAEVGHFLDLAAGRATVSIAPMEDAVAVTTILESEALSLATGRAVAPILPVR
jgi:predicted dehydrogenase